MSDDTQEATTERDQYKIPPEPSRKNTRRIAIGAVGLALALLVAANAVLWLRLDQTKNDLHNTRQQLGLVSSTGARGNSNLASQLADLSSRTDDLESQLGDAGSSSDVGTRLDDLETSVQTLTSCVDDFQNAISLGARYTLC